MAWKAPGLMKATTATRGTNNFVLSDPSNPGPYRTDVQANGDGSLPTGSTVHYQAWRTTTTGDAEFEEGWGTYTLATRVVARTAGQVIDGSAGPGTLVDFGLSGQMDVFFLAVLDGSDIPTSQHAAFATNLGLPRLSAANTFTADQAVRKASGTAIVSAGSAIAAGVTTRYDFTGNDSGGNNTLYSVIRNTIADATDGSEDGTLEFLTMVGGALGIRASISGGVFQDGSGNKFVAFPTGGTVKMLFAGAPGADWTRSNETNPSVIRLATSGDTLNASGGSSNIFSGWSTAGHTLTESQIPAHTHNVFNQDDMVDQNLDGTSLSKSRVATSGATDPTSSTGGGLSHSHGITTPYYRIAAWYVFN